MKKSVLFCLLLPFALQGQKVLVSEEMSIRENVSYFLLGDQRGNVLLFHDRATKFEVYGFDEHLHKQWEKEIELDKKRPEIIDVAQVGGDFCVFYTFREKNRTIIKAHRYNPAANLVDSIMVKDLGNVFLKPDLQTEYSEDKRTALVWSVDNQDRLNLYAFNMGQMKLLWERQLVVSDFIFARDFEALLIGNDGTVYLLLEKQNRRSKQETHFFEVIQCSGAGEADVKRMTLDMEGHLTFDVRFAIDNLNQALVAGGLYGDDNTLTANGFFYLNLPRNNPDAKILVFHPFERDFVNVLMEKDRSKNKGITEAEVQELVLRRDGGLILVGEMAKKFIRGGGSSAYYARTGIRPIVDHYHDDLFLFALHPDGSLHWKNILHKKQYSQDDAVAFSSFFLAKTPSALRFVFNDDVKPENTVSEYVVRGNGEFDRKAVMSTERQNLSIRFQDGIQVAANAFVAPSERRQKIKLVKVVYE